MAVDIELPAFTKLGQVGADALKRQPPNRGGQIFGVRSDVAHGADAATAGRVQARFTGTNNRPKAATLQSQLL